MTPLEYMENQLIKHRLNFDREFAREVPEEMLQNIRNKISYYEAAVEALKNPVVHSKWKYYHKQGKAVCMNCSFERGVDDNFGRAVACPNCGSRMDGDSDA